MYKIIGIVTNAGVKIVVSYGQGKFNVYNCKVVHTLWS